MVGGISKCIHEPGTDPAEDPRMSIIDAACVFIYHEDYMVCEVKMSNIGHASDSFFYIDKTLEVETYPTSTIMVW